MLEGKILYQYCREKNVSLTKIPHSDLRIFTTLSRNNKLFERMLYIYSIDTTELNKKNNMKGQNASFRDISHPIFGGHNSFKTFHTFNIDTYFFQKLR